MAGLALESVDFELEVSGSAPAVVYLSVEATDFVLVVAEVELGAVDLRIVLFEESGLAFLAAERIRRNY